MAVHGSPHDARLEEGENARLSTILLRLAAQGDGAVTAGRILDALGDRSLAAMLAVFAAVNLLPLPPGTTLVLGIPLVILSLQLLLGHQRVWLPKAILNRSLDARRVHDFLERNRHRLERLEQWIRPRYWPFGTRTSDRLVGLITFALGIIVTVPIPLGNWLPALATFFIALALSERDGVLLAIGLATALLSLAVVTAVVGTAGALASMLF